MQLRTEWGAEVPEVAHVEILANLVGRSLFCQARSPERMPRRAKAMQNPKILHPNHANH